MTDAARPTPVEADDTVAKRNVLILAMASALLGAQMPVHFILGGLAGQMLAENKALATLPISATVFCSMFAAPMIASIMGRYGRMTGFFVGTGGGALGAGVSALAIIQGSFSLLLIGSALTGFYYGGAGPVPFRRSRYGDARLSPQGDLAGHGGRSGGGGDWAADGADLPRISRAHPVCRRLSGGRGAEYLGEPPPIADPHPASPPERSRASRSAGPCVRFSPSLASAPPSSAQWCPMR